MALDVSVSISLVKPVGTIGWGYPLILSKAATAEDAVAYTECSDLAAVVTAGFAEAEGETPASATYSAAAKMFAQKHPPKKIAVCALSTISAATLAAILDKDWQQLVTVGVTGADLTAVITFINATSGVSAKTYFIGVADEADIATNVGASGSDNVFAVVHGTESELAAAAVAAEAAGNIVGSITYKNLVITGITPESLSEADVTAIHTANGNTVLSKAGDIVLSEGLLTSGEYADIIDCENYIVRNITYKTQKILNNMGKVPYDNRGIAILENACVDVLKDAFNKGMIAVNDDGTPAYSVSYGLRSEQPASNIAARKYTGGRFTFTLAGAVHDVEVTGEINVA